ncbi:MAG: hypothetical protein BZY88_11880 [SAR202 cluster bacterium Io17-Chloro-G9]|nr:MAG: hypothetical protein BZY88_11880 [SAR202 cluster bacterium Io17-Chloro-G9]
MLVGTKEGVVFLQRDAAGSGWSVAHRALTDKHIHAVIIEPTTNTIFAGATQDTVYASQDDGQTWEKRDKGITQQDIYSLAATQINGKVRVFAGTQPAHLFYSDDMGKNWSELTALRSVDTSAWHFPGPPHIAHTKHINFHPGNPETMFVSIEVGGLLKSTDGGQKFEVITGMDDDVHRTVINPQDPDRIYVTGGDGMYVTSNGGGSWEHWTTTDHEIGGYPDLLTLRPSDPNVAFVAAAHHGPGSWRTSHNAGSRISRSDDGGKTWQVLGNGLPDRLKGSIEAMSLEDWGESFSVFAATATGEVWGSDDGGQSWSEIISGLAPISKGNHYVNLVPA